MKTMVFKNIHKKDGFSLVEIIVALGLFTVVVMVALGALTSMVAANRKIQSTRVAMDNLNFSVETMLRTMRMGSVYNCGAINPLSSPRDCASSSRDEISFLSVEGERVVFRRVTDSGGRGRLQRSKSGGGGGTFLDITSAEIDITSLDFFVKGSLAGDGAQPRVLIIIEGVAGVKEREQTTFNIQSTVSQRILDS